MNLRTKIAIQLTLGVLFGLALLAFGSGAASENVGRGVNYRYTVILPALSVN